MARTAVINPRRKRRAPKRRTHTKRARRRNPSTPLGRAPKRRRNASRRRYSSRRRNPTPASVYRTSGYRKQNPAELSMERVMDVAPAATLGAQAVRWALNMAGPFEEVTVTGDKGVEKKIKVPGIKHAIAGVLASHYAATAIAQVLGSDHKAEFAEIGGYAMLGDVFLHKRFFRNSDWAEKNMFLGGVEDESAEQVIYVDENGNVLSGLQETSNLGAEMVQAPDGTMYLLSGLQETSNLGGANIEPDPVYRNGYGGSAQSGFGYAGR